MSPTLTEAEIAYVAGVLDTRGYLGRRRSGEAELPTISVTMKAPSRVISRLCDLTAVKPIAVGKNYNRHGCSDHCPEPHVHIVGEYARWIVTGIKARIILTACLPHLWALRSDVEQVLAATEGQPYKPASLRKMSAWAVSA